MAHPSRFDPTHPTRKDYRSVRWPDRTLPAHAHDFNDAVLHLDAHVRRVGAAAHRDGSVLEGGAAVVDPITGEADLAAAKVYAGGDIYAVAARADLTVPVSGVAQIGVSVLRETVTPDDDDGLRGEIPGTEALGDIGADRRKETARWCLAGECAGDFFAVYTVTDGLLLTPEPPVRPQDELIARYDRESNGHYIVEGWEVLALGDVASDGRQHFTVTEGVANVWGYKREATVARRHIETEAPDLFHIEAEPHVAAGGAGETIEPSYAPIVAQPQVTILRETALALTHGPYSGAEDETGLTSVQSIVSITQGGTTYVAGTDYALNGDAIQWLPGANDEPAPGSSYTATLRYYDAGAPDAWTPTSVTVSDAVAGSSVLLRYDFALPRVDVIAADRDGAIRYIKGKSALHRPIAPAVPLEWLALARVSNDWLGAPGLTDVAIRSVPFARIEALSSVLAKVLDLTADLAMKQDMDARQPTSKRGQFTDPFFDDDLRDQGLAQTAAVFGGHLRLPLLSTVTSRSLGSAPLTLELGDDRLAIEQPLVTGSEKIQPYLTFEPIPARVRLTPAVHLWSEVDSEWLSAETRQNVTNVPRTALRAWDRVFGEDDVARPTVTGVEFTASEIAGLETREAEFLPELTVRFEADGFGVGEILDRVEFDGVEVAAAPDPNGSNSLTADAEGRIDGLFDIPPGVTVGAKRVEVYGQAGTRGSTSFVGGGQVTVIQARQVTTVNVEQVVDPLAQTFTLAQSEALAAVDLQFAALGDPASAVWVQLREVENGVPTQRVLAEARIADLSGVTLGEWTQFRFDAPVPLQAGVEYCFVAMTSDLDHALNLAGLGELDPVAQRFVTEQPYVVGVLLTSSNNSTWTPHQERDLTFRLHTASHAETTRTVALAEPVAVVDCTDLIVQAIAEEPTPETRVTVRVTRDGGQIFLAELGQRIQFGDRITEDLTVEFLLAGTAVAAPVLFPDVTIIASARGASGDYISRAMRAGSEVDQQQVVVSFDAKIPTGSSLVVEVGEPGDWRPMALANAEEVGGGFTLYDHTIEDYELETARIRMTLNGSDAAEPLVRELRANVTPDPINIITGG